MPLRNHSQRAERTPRQSRVDPPTTNSVQLTRATATGWLNLLNRMASQDPESAQGLEQLRNRLEDDCWLARWKREQVDFDFCPTMITDVLQELLQVSQSDLAIDDLRAIEEMTEILSSNWLGNSAEK